MKRSRSGISIQHAMRYQFRVLLSVLASIASLVTAMAQPGSNDPMFNIADTGYGNGEGVMGTVRGMALQPDGNVVVCGEFDRVQGNVRHKVARLNADGSIDPTFVAALDYDGYATNVAVQADGKVLVLGYFWMLNGDPAPSLMRLNADGSVDATFTTGWVSEVAEALAIRSDGKILVGGGFATYNGSPAPGIVRLNDNGSIDTAFDPGAGLPVNAAVVDIAVFQDDRIIVAGAFTSFDGVPRNRIARLLADGALDTTFDPGTGLEGQLNLMEGTRAFAVAVTVTGEVTVVGNFTTYDGSLRNGIARINSDGTLDTTFDPGPGANATVMALALRADGSVIAGGSFEQMGGTARNGIVRLLANGNVDTTFDPGIGVDVSWLYNGVQCMALQPDDHVLIGGAFTSCGGFGRNRLARLNSDGSTDPAFMPSGTGLNNTAYVVTAQPDGKVLVGGAFSSVSGVGRNRIARLNEDGSLDASFDPGAGFNGYYVESITVQPDGKIIVGGEFTMFNGSAAPHVVRLNNDGSRDNTFDTGTGTDGSVLSSAVLAGGKIMIAGNFGTVNGVPTGFVARLNSDGSHDPTFMADPLVGGYIPAMVVQPDGKVIVGGPELLRLNTDGSIDPSFDVTGGPWAGGFVFSLALRPDGKVLAAGGNDPGIMQVNPDGSPDPGFDPGTGFDAYFDATPMVVQADGKVVVGGWYNTFDGVPRSSIVRLNTVGSLDATFDPGNGASSFVYALALQADGKVIAAGNFIEYDGAGRNHIARIITAGDGCIPSQLTTTADPVISCGATNLNFTGTSIIAATEVPGANKYQFLFTNVPGQPPYNRSIAKPSRSFVLTKWHTLPLKAGRTYNVAVRASSDNGATWCAYGPSCTVKMSWTPMAPIQELRDGEDAPSDGPVVLFYPNPTNGTDLHITSRGMHPEPGSVWLEITNTFGERIMSRTLPSNPGELDAVIPLPSDLSSGLYIATIKTGDGIFTQRLVIER